MADDLDADTLVMLSVLGEMELQCTWAQAHLESAKANLDEMFAVKIPPARNVWKRRQYKSAVFREIQAFLTCAAIANSLLTGKVAPRPKGLQGTTPAQRNTIRAELALPEGFRIEGGPQRNALIHIEERLIRWAKPGGLRGDFYVSPREFPVILGDQQPLRAVGKVPFEFAVLGERCSLAEMEASLDFLRQAAGATHHKILDSINAKSPGPSTDDPI